MKNILSRAIQIARRAVAAGVGGLVILSAPTLPVHGQAGNLSASAFMTPTDTNRFVLVSTNYNVFPSTLTNATIVPIPGIGTQELDVVLTNYGTNQVLYTSDGTIPSSTTADLLNPYYGLIGGGLSTNSLRQVDTTSIVKFTNRQSPITMNATNGIVGGTTVSNRVHVVQRMWVPLQRNQP